MGFWRLRARADNSVGVGGIRFFRQGDGPAARLRIRSLRGPSSSGAGRESAAHHR